MFNFYFLIGNLRQYLLKKNFVYLYLYIDFFDYFFISYDIELSNFFIFSLFFFFIGLLGFIINKYNFILYILCIEIMLTSAILNLLLLSNFYFDFKIQVYVLLIIVVIACESIIGLGLLVVCYRLKISLNIFIFNKLGG
jgi:NADH-quinone oxidoreductase subunit K